MCGICFEFKNLTLVLFCLVSVTVVDSATRALQYLGLDGDNSSVGFEVIECFVAFFFVLE